MPPQPDEVLENLFARIQDEPVGLTLAPAGLHELTGAVVALRQTGALDDAAAAVWQQRLEAHMQRLLASDELEALRAQTEAILLKAPYVPSAPAIKERALRLLADAVTQVSYERQAISQFAHGGGASVTRAEGMVRALREVGVIDDEERDAWLGQIGDTARLAARGCAW